MRDRYTRHRRGSLAFGVMAIIVGVVFLLYQSDVFPATFHLDFWAVVFTAAGLAQFLTGCEGRNRIWGIALIALGAVMQTNAMGYTHLHMRQLWPLFIIVAGISALWHTMNDDPTRRFKVGMFQKGDGDTAESVHGNPPEEGSEVMNPEINMDFFLGGGEPRIESKNFRGGRVNAVLGGFVLDLRRADIEGNEAVLYVTTMMGGGEIKVPESWLVEMHGSAILGGYDNKTRFFQPDATKPVKRLIIRGSAILGGIEVKN
jgi:predicted membrane protein